MAILEYKLQAGPHGMHCPDWVENGGYFYNPTDFTMVGWSRDNAEWYTPDTVVVMTPEELETRQVNMHNANPMQKMTESGEMESMTEEEVREQVQSWISSV
jgi:hypothetical protein